MAMRSVTLISIFLASPIEFSDERAGARRACDELNSTYGRHLGVRFELLSWDTYVPPGSGPPQTQIFRFMSPSNTDIFVALIGQRLGAGVRRECDLALETRKSRNEPDLWFYFRLPSPDDVPDASELAKVREFAAPIQESHLVVEYDDAGDFESRFRMDLYRWLEQAANEQRLLASPPVALPPSRTSPAVPTHTPAVGQTPHPADYPVLENYEWYHLQQLRHPHPHKYEWRESLVGELERLEAAGFMARKTGSGRPLRDVLPRSGFLMADYFELTSAGNEYIDLRWRVNPADNWTR